MLVATAGHIDHGKTSLIRALTGAETDRLPEERRRGMSIDLGFAYWRPDDGATIGFIDVPGHEKFIRNMLAGIGGIDLALIVVAADDGVMPQTREHVAMLELLGIADALVAVTKVDRADPERVATVHREVALLLAGTVMAAAPILDVSSQTGAGIAELTDALRAHRDRPCAAHAAGRGFRLAIDRAFVVGGAGTVVTGTVLAGSVAVGDRLTVIPQEREVRVRGLQSAGAEVTSAGTGERCALNLAPIEVGELRRGEWVLAPALAATSTRMTVELTVSAAREAPLRHNAQLRMHHGTAAISARVLIPRGSGQKPGETRIVQMVLDRPTHALSGDRFVLRDGSDRELIGGGTVIDPLAPTARRQRQAQPHVTAALLHNGPEAALAALLANADTEIDCDWFALSFGLVPDAAAALFAAAGAVVAGRERRIAIPGARFGALGDAAVAALAEFHAEHPELGGLPAQDLRRRMSPSASPDLFGAVLRDLADARRIETAAALIRLPGHRPSFAPGETALWNAMLGWLGDCGPRPIVLSEIASALGASEDELRAMLGRRRAAGDLWAISDTKFMLRDHVAILAGVCAKLSAANPDGFTAAQLRDASGIGRNFIIQLVEFFDRLGVTIRRGDARQVWPDYEAVVGSASPESR